MMTKQKYTGAILILAIGWVMMACSDEDAQPELKVPSASNIEIGYDNSKEGTVGKDFHFNADVVAGEKIESIIVQIQQREGMSYAEAWGLFLEWEEYEGLKNVNIHKHFTIPEDAPIGKYDFIFTVRDTNGTHLEVREGFEIIKE